ncbi:MAG: hypothetical protein K0Q59_3577 [Paenibacillus sp.]|nr:hypothetical protein [Paenibacillus sp.]
MGNEIELVCIWLVLLLGSVIQGMSGFGFGMFSVGLLSLMLPLGTVTTLLFTLTTVLSSSILFKLWRYIVWRELTYILVGGLLGRAGGYVFLHTFGEAPWMRKLLGVIMLAMVLYGLIANRLNLTKLEKWNDPLVALALGGAGGFVSGVFAAGGPFMVMYFLIRCEDKNRYHAHLQTAFVVTNVFSVLLQGFSGGWDRMLLLYVLSGSVAVWVGMRIGLKLFGRFSKVRVTQVTYAIMGAVSIQLMLQ